MQITPELAKAIAAAQAELRPAPKDSNNPHFKSTYASLQSIADTARPILSKHGLAVIQTFERVEAGDVMHITTTLLHISGGAISGTLSLKPERANPQGIGSAITYARRYSLAAILGMVTDDDDDANAASGKGSKPADNPIKKETLEKLRAYKDNPAASKLIKDELAKVSATTAADLYEDEGQAILKAILNLK